MTAGLIICRIGKTDEMVAHSREVQREFHQLLGFADQFHKLNGLKRIKMEHSGVSTFLREGSCLELITQQPLIFGIYLLSDLVVFMIPLSDYYVLMYI